MTPKTQMKWLEKLFVREIEIALNKTEEISPLQIPKKQAQSLLAEGLIEEKTITRGILKFRFHRLSDAGRFIYCVNCKDEEQEDEGTSDRLCQN